MRSMLICGNASDFAYEYEHDRLPIDILAGSDAFRRLVESDAPPAAIADTWRDDEMAFEELRKPFLLYD